jgi:hypothetical protein
MISHRGGNLTPQSFALFATAVQCRIDLAVETSAVPTTHFGVCATAVTTSGRSQILGAIQIVLRSTGPHVGEISGSLLTHQSTWPTIFHFESAVMSMGEYLWFAETRTSAEGSRCRRAILKP